MKIWTTVETKEGLTLEEAIIRANNMEVVTKEEEVDSRITEIIRWGAAMGVIMAITRITTSFRIGAMIAEVIVEMIVEMIGVMIGTEIEWTTDTEEVERTCRQDKRETDKTDISR